MEGLGICPQKLNAFLKTYSKLAAYCDWNWIIFAVCYSFNTRLSFFPFNLSELSVSSELQDWLSVRSIYTC